MADAPKLETVYQIWTEDGERFEIGEDADGLGCVEVRYYDENGKVGDRIMFNPQIAALVAEAIQKYNKAQETK